MIRAELSQKTMRRRALRLELLETRALLTAAPWGEFIITDRAELIDASGAEESRFQDSQREGRDRRDADRAERGDFRDNERGERGRGLRPEFQGRQQRSQGRIPRGNRADFARPLRTPLPFTGDLQFDARQGFGGLSNSARIPCCMLSNREPLDPSSEDSGIVIDLVPDIGDANDGLVPEAEPSPPVTDSLGGEPPEARPPRLLPPFAGQQPPPSEGNQPSDNQSSGNRPGAIDPNGSGRDRQDVRTAQDLFQQASPIIGRADEVVVDAAQPNVLQPTYRSFLDGSESSLGINAPESQAVYGAQNSALQRSLDLAIQELAGQHSLDAQQAANLQELEDYLESLAEQRHRAESQSPSGQTETLSLQHDSTDQPNVVDSEVFNARLQAFIDQQRLQREAGGMIAMELPRDMLLEHHAKVQHDADQSEAWTARIGYYRAFEIAAANGGHAAQKSADRAAREDDLKERETSADHQVASRLQPIVAATSAAFGAIFISLRSKKRKSDARSASFEKLS